MAKLTLNRFQGIIPAVCVSRKCETRECVLLTIQIAKRPRNEGPNDVSLPRVHPLFLRFEQDLGSGLAYVLTPHFQMLLASLVEHFRPGTTKDSYRERLVEVPCIKIVSETIDTM
jgi:hypothetical protein